MTEDEITKDILQRLTRAETKLDLMLEKREIAAQALGTANEALQSSKSALHRIEKIDKVIFWAATTVIGALIVGATALLFRFRGV